MGHDLLGQRSRRPHGAAGEVVGEHQRGGRQRVVPVVLAYRVQEHVPDEAGMGVGSYVSVGAAGRRR